MIKANDITRKSWIKYDKNSDFPIQNIPFGVFKSKKPKDLLIKNTQEAFNKKIFGAPTFVLNNKAIIY